jgi:hypothetical protein
VSPSLTLLPLPFLNQHIIPPECGQQYLVSSGDHRLGKNAGGRLRPLLVLLFKAFFVLSTLERKR